MLVKPCVLRPPDAIASNIWNDIHISKQWGTCPNEHVARFVKRNIPEGGRILDIGCGVGANAVWLATEGYKIDAIDISSAAIEKLHQRWGATEPKVGRLKALTHDISKLPILNDSYDAVIDVCVLQHLSETDAALTLKEALRVLKPGGQMFSIIAAPSHSIMAFPDGICTTLWTGDDIKLRFTVQNDFNVESIEPSVYGDEIYGQIAHWLVRARKPEHIKGEG